MLLQDVYTAFAKMYLAQPELSSTAAETCLQHAHAICAAMQSDVPGVRNRLIELRILEFLVRLSMLIESDCSAHACIRTGTLH